MKPIPQCPGYMATEDGHIYSIKAGKMLAEHTSWDGYKRVHIHLGEGRKTQLVHRLVAKAFIPNPLNLPQINHRDENPSNNAVSNLEWCSPKYNMNYGIGAKTRQAKINHRSPLALAHCREMAVPLRKPVIQSTKDGREVARYSSAYEAHLKTGASHSAILSCCHGKPNFKTAKGFRWSFERSEDLLASQ